MALAVSAVITFLLLFCGRFLFDLFTDTAELMDLAVRMMRILAAGYIAISITQVLGGVMRGCGDTTTPMWVSLISTIVLRIPIAYGLAFFTRGEGFPNGRPEAIFVSLLISWVLGAVITAIVFSRGRWRTQAAEVTSLHPKTAEK